MIDVIMRFIFMSKLFDITLQKRNSLLSKRAGNEWAENRNKNFKIAIINRYGNRPGTASVTRIKMIYKEICINLHLLAYYIYSGFLKPKDCLF